MADVIGSVLLLSVLALAPIIGGGLGELTNGILQILVFGGIGCWLLMGRKDSGQCARVPGLWFAAAFVLLSVISTIFTRAIYLSLNQLLLIVACMGAYMLSATVCRDKRMAAAAVWTLLLSALLISALGIRFYAITAGGGASFWKSILGPGEHDRLFGPFINPSFFAGYLVIALPITLGVYLVTRRAVLVMLAGIGFVVDVLALMLTGAKFGIVAAVAGLGLFFLLAIATKSLRRSRFARLLVMCVIILPLLMVFSAPVRSRIQAAESGGSQVHSTVFRVYTWEATWNMIKDHPWLGVGPGVYAITYPRYTIAGPTKLAHSSYLQTAAESGIPALVAFLLLLMAMARRSLLGIASGSTRPSYHQREAPDEPDSDSIAWTDMIPFSAWRLMNCALFAGLVGSAVRSMVDSDWYVIGVSLPFWVVAGVMVAQSGAAQRDMPMARTARWALAALCAVAVLMSASFGLGDWFAAGAKAAVDRKNVDAARVIDLYERASIVSPLDPEYHRMLGLWLGSDKEIDRSIDLARDTSEGGWYARALLAGSRRDWPTAISSLKTALHFSPNSTQTLDKLARAYRASGDMHGYESTLRKLLVIEDSPYEQVKGTPEIVDTTFAFAHAYFGGKYLERRKYGLALREFTAAIDRLERWRSSGVMRKVQQMMGGSPADERERLDLLRECYKQLAAACTGIGNKAEAAESLSKAAKVK